MKAKNYFKGLTAIVLSVLTILTTLPLTAFVMPTAATSNDSTSINLTLGDKLRYDSGINWSTHQMYADGRMAYCVNPKLTAPSGKYGSNNLTAVSEKSNTFAMLYKGLHYGYDGHGFNAKVAAFGNKSMKQLMDKAKSDHWLGASGNSLYYLLTHRVLAKIYGDKDWSYALTSDWIKAVNELEAALKKAAKLKSEYSMYLLDPKNNQQKVIIMQDKLGGLEIIKDSSNHTLTDNSGCYSLKGAEFTVTNTKTKKSYTITANTKVDDGSATVKYKAILKNIVAGTYTVKETKAPKGYALSKETKTVTVKAGTTAAASVTFKDQPQSDPVYVLLKKTNGNGKKIAGAEFTVRFYKGYFTKAEIESGKADSAFKRYWTIKTNENGYAELLKKYLVDSNNDFYYSSGENPNPVLPLGTVTIQETKAPAGYVKDNTLYVQQITSNSSLASVSTYNEFTNVNSPSTYYKIKKTSEDGVVAGVSFKIYEGSKVDEAKYLKTVKTGSNGEIKEKLDIGTYTFDEVKSAKYVSQPAKTITITAENTSANPAVIKFENKLNDGTLKIRKASSDGNISGIKFEIYKGKDTAGQLVGTYVTDDSGFITKDLKPATYCIHEIVPDGYKPVSDRVITIRANQERTVTFRNIKSGSQVKIIKETDNYDAGPFTCKINEVDKENGTEKFVMSVDIDTYEPTIINLEDGTYKITEILTDKQKQLWQEIKPVQFTVNHEVELITITLQNHEKTGDIKVIKTASDNFVEGKEFSLYGESDAGFEIQRCVRTTNKDGIAVFENIPVGKYVLEEVSSHAIYNVRCDVDLDNVPIEWNKVTNVSIKNDEKTTTFEVVKTSEDGNVKGFEFEITGTTTSGDSVKLTKLITDDKGRITGNLYPGEYVAKEVKTHSKYIQPSEQKFTIEQTTNDNPAPVQLFFYNELKKGSLEITKTAYDGFIENVEFSLTSKEDSSVVYHTLTDETGKAVLNDVPIGEYILREENIGEQYVEIGDINVVIYYNEITKKSVENKPKDGYLKVIKTSDSKNLKGFEFEIIGKTWDNKEIKKTYTTDENGLIAEKLPTGTYTIKEINAPNYFIQTQEAVLELTPYDTSDEPYTINIYNEYKRGSLKVIKSADDNFVENIKFNLSGTADCGEKVNITVTTNAEGCAEFNDVPIGTYNFSELTKEDRYVTVLDMEQTIEWNKVISVAVNNKLKTGEIQTTAKDTETGEHYAYANENTKIVDTVAYKDIAANQLYKLTGTIMNKETGEPLLVNNEKVVASKEFISSPTGAGTVDVEFSFNSADLVGKSIVVFEELSIKDKDNNDYVLAVHSNINDDGQTIIFNDPKIRTTAHDAVSNNNTAITDTATTIVDTVTYSDLIVEKEYTVAGTLMVKSSGKELTDSNGSPITASKTFTAENTDGSVEIEFTFDSSLLAGESVVAFERLYYNGREIAVHTDINDGGQTVTFTEPPTEPPTEPTVPPTEPPTEPTEPTVPPTEPTVPPTEPIEPTVPPTEPTVPTEPTEPPTEPTQPADSTVPPATEQTTVPGAGIDSNIPGARIATGETDYLYIIAALCATLAFVIIIFAKKTNEK
ncbi:tQXA domain-containing protein [Clostridium sp. CAG:964]|nr:tQXA domain-containing protein [Clostridium sp. CAG:964]